MAKVRQVWVTFQSKSRLGSVSVTATDQSTQSRRVKRVLLFVTRQRGTQRTTVRSALSRFWIAPTKTLRA